MAARARSLILGAAVFAVAAGGGAGGQAQPSPDPIDQVLRSGAPAQPNAKPREDAPGAEKAALVAPPPADTASADEDNGDADSAAPSSRAAAAKSAEPLTRPRYTVAVVQALDKVTAETVRFEAPVNQPIRYKTLIFTVHACETTAPDEANSDAIAHLEIDNQPKGPDGAPPPPARQVFKGWMYASSPGLNLFQHPIYDAWLIACKTVSPAA